MSLSTKPAIRSWLIRPIKNWLKQRLNAWLKRRIPQAQQQRINYRNIFIMPTRFGIAFCFFTLLLFLLGTNYQNNIILLISYLLVSFFIVVLHHSFFNLSGLKFATTGAIKGYVDSQLSLPLIINSKKSRFNIHFSFLQELANQQSKVVLELLSGECEILVPFQADKRGQIKLPRVLIASEYGFGLFRTWTRLDFAQQATIFPKPLSYAWQESQQAVKENKQNEIIESEQSSFQPGHDEFYQLQQYQQGEPFSRVAWKQVARGQGWLSKQFQQNLSGQLQLDFSSLPEASVEQKLSLLSYAISDCSRQQIAFSLKLPNQEFPYNNSPEHTLNCLTALACY